MAVKWIKLATNIFDDCKIKHLRKQPEGNNIVLIWVMLLTIAGKCNAGGKIFLTENIPYSLKMLADELEFKESVVEFALDKLNELEMIEIKDNYLKIREWEDYQNTEEE